MGNEESNYITQKEIDKLHKTRRARQLAALRADEQQGIAAALNTSDEVAAEALELGFDTATAVILPMVPLIEIAWADGRIEEKERQKVKEFAAANGITDAGALEFLELLMENKPSNLFFKRTNRVVAHIIADDPNNPTTQDVLTHALAVAESAGSFFGLTSAVSGAERDMLAELAKILNVG